ncbi:hypothetical protein JXB02_05810 [Candidatus Woesearchaeota archaeon]|nr:hypothetical protein [Candidatus Woesearchaeota archaeon]
MASITHNLKRHELVGILLVFLAGICLGFGLYVVQWFANRPLYYGSLDYLPAGRDFLLIVLFFGVGAVLWVLGKIELRETLPGKRQR